MAVKRATFEKLADKFLNNTFADFAKTINIIEEVETPDGQGGTSTERVAFANNVKCFVFPMVGKENVEAGGLYSDQTFKFSMEPVLGLNDKMIIVYINNDNNEFDYKIEPFKNLVEANIWIDVIAEKDSPR